MPTSNIDQRVKRIVGLTDAEAEDLKLNIARTEEDLKYLQFVDYPLTLPVVKRRKLEIVSNYLAAGKRMTATITMDEINDAVNAPAVPIGVAAPGVVGVIDPNRGAPKIYTDPLSDFSGDAVDYEDWERKSGATIKQTCYKDFLTRSPNAGDVVEEARSKELFNMILSCVAGGHALNTIEKIRDDNAGLECGYKAWKALNDWYIDPTQTDSMIHHWETKLDAIELDKDTSATEYINNFELYVRKLIKLGENWSDDKQVREFKRSVTDPDYDTEVRIHKGTFSQLVEIVRKRERDLESNADHRSRKNKRTRRVRYEDDDDKQETSNSSAAKTETSSLARKTPYIPFIPKFLYRSLDELGKRNVAKWRKLTNQGETMGPDDLVKSSTNDKDEDTTPPPTKHKRKKTRRVTKTRRVGMADHTIEVKLASSDSDYSEYRNISHRSASKSRDDSNNQSKLDHSIKNSVNNSTIRALKRNMSVGISRGSVNVPPYAVIDPGAEKEVVGGVGWRILHFSDKSESLNGPLAGMGNSVLPTVDAVTAMQDNEGKTVLVGIGDTSYDRRTTQYEALLNSHHLRSNKVIVDDVAKEVGGTQCMKFRDLNRKEINIPFRFNGDIMTVDLREPTEEELVALRVNWLLPPMEDITPQSIRRSRTLLENFEQQVPGEPDSTPEKQILMDAPNEELVSEKSGRTTEEWKQLLAFPSDKVVKKTLNSTTQLQIEPVESERREIPRQHRKKRLLMLYPRRLKGRTDTDTFFSTVKSIRGYLCVQIFCHIMSDFLFVRCMQRESHSHGAYQDYIREVGASELIVTDNSKTQTGKKWEKTSRETMTKQRRFTPHNQNESKVERRIQDVKHKTTLVLQRSKAPVLFWCYALIFVIDCLNHIAKKPLGWKTSTEVLNGDTVDISPFRFRFWQPVKFLADASFPDSRWMMGRFLGIAWDTGDLFTFKVWSEPEGRWQDGMEYTRNVVRPRVNEELPDDTQSDPDIDKFKFQRKYRTNKRKRGRNDTFELKDVPDLPDADYSDGEGMVTDEVKDSRLNPTESTIIEEDVLDSGENESNIQAQETTTSTTPTQTQQQKFSSSNNTASNQDDLDSEEVIESIDEINDHLSRPDEMEGIGGSLVKEILGHDFKHGVLRFKIQWNNGDTSWESLRDMKQDYPRLTAQYLVGNYTCRSSRGVDRILKWAKNTVRDLDRAVRRITRLYDIYLNDHDEIKMTRRTVKGSKKKKKTYSKVPIYKYGIQVPRSVKHADELDVKNGNNFWKEAFEKEVKALLDLDCFEFHPAGYHQSLDKTWQRTTLHMVFDVKQDLRRKCRLVAGGHLVDMMDIQVYSSTVNSISIQLLHVISHKENLQQLCGDIGNAFPNAYTKEKVFIPKAGIEFGEHAGKCIVIKRALYGLCSSAERFHAHLVDTLRSFGFNQTRSDNDVWIRLEKSGQNYEYICTHVDDFMICAKNAQGVMDEICSIYKVKESSKGPLEYYLGNDYRKDKQGRWRIGCKTYLMEAISRVEKLIVKPLPKKDTPMVDGDHPEEDSTSPLNDQDHQQYQMLIGMLNWIVCIGRIDIAYATSSLSRFTACPRQGHKDRVLRVFGYLKKYRNRRIVVDSRDPIRVGGDDALKLDFTDLFKEQYPDAAEEIDAKVPAPKVNELEITAFVDSDHAHDRKTRRSITGLLILVGRTPVYFMSKRQGAIATSTYGAEFCAMKTAVEEVQSIRYMLRCLGVKITYPSLVCGDNNGVILNSQFPDSLLKKKCLAIAFHKTRESAAAGIVHPIKIKSEHNFSDILTKAVTGKTFWTLYGKLTRS